MSLKKEEDISGNLCITLTRLFMISIALLKLVSLLDNDTGCIAVHTGSGQCHKGISLGGTIYLQQEESKTPNGPMRMSVIWKTPLGELYKSFNVSSYLRDSFTLGNIS